MRKIRTPIIRPDPLSALRRMRVDPYRLLAALSATAPMGIGVWDRRLHFRFVNDALALMNGYPATDHFGKPLDKIIGALTDKVAPTREHVLRTGEILNDVQYGGLLPTRTETGHWIETSFPFRDKRGKIVYVGAVVLEVTQIVRLRDAVKHFGAMLCDASSALHTRRFPISATLEPFLRRSILGVRAISEFLTPTLLGNIVASLCDPLSRITLDACDDQLSTTLRRTDTSVPLSSRQQQVLQLVTLGRCNKEIAQVLKISTRTVETHRERLMLKLGLHSVPELVRYAIRHRLI